MVCYVCHQSNWHERPDIHKERLLMICKECGNVAYKIATEEEKKMKDYYINEYRGKIGPLNLLTTSRKLNYVKEFLREFLESKKEQMIVGDVGCATGYLVDWFRRQGHKATGSEWTTTMRRFSEHFYGAPVTEELETKHKYDLITMYHTFEHMIEPDKKLTHYMSLLKEDGHILISTPQWFFYLEEPGGGAMKTIENFFHKDHINVYSETSLKNMFRTHGLEILKEDHITYGQTYLLKKGKFEDIVKEDWKKIDDNITKMKMAVEEYGKANKSGDVKGYRKALSYWPLFPEAYQGILHNTIIKKDTGRAEDVLKEGIKAMPDNVRLHALTANWLYQNERYEEAIKEYDWVLSKRLGEDFLMYRGWCLVQIGQPKEAMKSFNEAQQLNPEKWNEAMKWICKISSDQLTWDERAKKDLQKQFFNENKQKVVLDDPLFREKESVPSK